MPSEQAVPPPHTQPGETRSPSDGQNREVLEKPRFRFGNPSIIQTTPDNSLGGDVVRASEKELIIVDGTLSGADAKRSEAEALASILHDNNDLLFNSQSYVSVKPEKSQLKIRARGGTIAVAWIQTAEAIEPSTLWLGDDELHPGPSLKLFDAKNTVGITLLSDGGIHILAHPDIFGLLRGSVTAAPDIAIRFQRGKIDYEFMEGALKRILTPFTTTLNRTGNFDETLNIIAEQFQRFQKLKNVTPLDLDDATLVSASLMPAK